MSESYKLGKILLTPSQRWFLEAMDWPKHRYGEYSAISFEQMVETIYKECGLTFKVSNEAMRRAAGIPSYAREMAEKLLKEKTEDLPLVSEVAPAAKPTRTRRPDADSWRSRAVERMARAGNPPTEVAEKLAALRIEASKRQRMKEVLERIAQTSTTVTSNDTAAACRAYIVRELKKQLPEHAQDIDNITSSLSKTLLGPTMIVLRTAMGLRIRDFGSSIPTSHFYALENETVPASLLKDGELDAALFKKLNCFVTTITNIWRLRDRSFHIFAASDAERALLADHTLAELLYYFCDKSGFGFDQIAAHLKSSDKRKSYPYLRNRLMGATKKIDAAFIDDVAQAIAECKEQEKPHKTLRGRWQATRE